MSGLYGNGFRRLKRQKQNQSHDWEWREKDATQCECGKKKFASVKDANRALNGLWRHEDCTGMEVYLCDISSYYHLGHATERLRERRHEKAMEVMGDD